MNSLKERGGLRRANFAIFIIFAIALVSWTLPRVGVFKLTEILSLFGLLFASIPKSSLRLIFNCFGFFAFATIFAFLSGFFMLGVGDNSVGSDKAFYTFPSMVLCVSMLRIVMYLVMVTVLTHFFRTTSTKSLKRTFSYCYVLTLLPGLIQLFRMYSGLYFDIPIFERFGVGPFSGVFDAGYLRIMGFEFEPLAYATSLILVCCLRWVVKGKIPVVGIVLLAHTFSLGAFVGIGLGILVGWSKRARKLIVPAFLLFFVILSIGVYLNLNQLLDTLILPSSVLERINALGACINMWLDHPLGVGLGLYGYFFNLYDSAGFSTLQLDFYPNNDPAMFLAYGGVLYLFAYLWIFHYSITSTESRWVRIALVSFLIQSLSSYLIFNPAAAVLISLAIAGRDLKSPTGIKFIDKYRCFYFPSTTFTS